MYSYILIIKTPREVAIIKKVAKLNYVQFSYFIDFLTE